MADDIDPRDDWLDGRLKAAVRDAERLPRHRLLLPTNVPRASRVTPQLRRHGLVAGLVALNVVTGAVAFRVGLGLSNGNRSAATSRPPASSPLAPARAVLAAVPLDGALRGDPVIDEGALAVGAGSVWVASAGTGAVVRIDEQTARVLARIPVGAPRPGEAFSSEGGFPSSVATDGSSVWATADAEHAVVRIDPATNRVVDRITLDVEPTSLAVTGGIVWVTSRPSDRLVEVDTLRHRAVATFATGSSPERIAVAGGSVWVVNRRDGTISRLDVATGRVTTTPAPDTYDYGYVSVAVDGSRAWGLDFDRGVIEPIDPVTMQPGPGIAAIPGGVGIAVDHGVAWVVSGAALTHIDLTSGSPSPASPLVGGASVVAADGALWVLVGDRNGTVVERLSTAS